MATPEPANFLQAPEAVTDYLKDNWQAARAGRADVPALVADPKTDKGVLITQNRDHPGYNSGMHDLIHVYHPEGGALTLEDKGYQEEGSVETVQIDIEVTNRTDPNDPAARLEANERLKGTRGETITSAGFTLGGSSGATLGGSSGGTLGSSGSVAYPGIFGEVKYLLEGIRRGLDEWDVTRNPQPVNVFLGAANANVSLDLGLEHIARRTRQ